MSGVTGFSSTGDCKELSVGVCLGFNAAMFRKLRHGYSKIIQLVLACVELQPISEVFRHASWTSLG